MPKKLTQEEFIVRAKAVHGDRYGYELVEYKNKEQKVIVICRDHGPFTPTPHNHANGSGCPVCGIDKRASSKTMTKAEFVSRSRELYGEKYDYSETIYVGNKKKLGILCPEHGIFYQTPNDHLTGHGCKRCGVDKRADAQSLSHAEFVSRSNKVHGSIYDYSQAEYLHNSQKVKIVCNKHGVFYQHAGSHMKGHGCPKCSNLGPSNGELEVLEFVQSLGLDVVGSDRTVIAPKEIDIYVPSKKIGIEFNGTHFHSDKYKNKNDHKHKSDLCAAAGVRLIHMLEADWQERRPQMERLIRNALGMSNDRKINARDCYVEQISVADANVFLAQWHPQGKGGHNAVPFGLKTKTDNELVAVMTFAKDAYRRNPATANRDEQWGNWDLTRYTTSASVRGGASKLFKHFVEWSGADIVQSFSANNWFSGGLYHALGFVVKEHTAPDYQVWHPKTGIRGKSTWRRTNIPLRLKEIGSDLEFDPETTKMTEWMVEDAVGAKRIWDSGKIKWEWQAHNRK
ncbi:hypothetical protein [Xanthomonas phage L522]|nr:hypothetical protein [Xanthomonas phage L522]